LINQYLAKRHTELINQYLAKRRKELINQCLAKRHKEPIKQYLTMGIRKSRYSYCIPCRGNQKDLMRFLCTLPSKQNQEKLYLAKKNRKS
jgi:hypothetical protein